MPSPGIPVLRTALAVPITVESGQSTRFSESGLFIGQLATAMDAGWTCASPSTPSTFAGTFMQAFPHIYGGGLYLQCIASGLDDEVATWIASWDSDAWQHHYVVNAPSIYQRIMGCSPVNSAGTRSLAQAVADAFMLGFDQGAG